MKFKLKSILLITLLLFQSKVFSGTNVSLSEFVNSIRGPFNMLVAEKYIVSAKKLRKTNKMIEKGYRNEVRNMQLLLETSGLNAHVRMLNEKRFSSFSYQEKEFKKELEKMVQTLSNAISHRLDNTSLGKENDQKSNRTVENKLQDSSDDIGTDIEFDGTLFEISTDLAPNKKGSFVSLNNIAEVAFLDLAELYGDTTQFKGKKVQWYSAGAEQEITLGRRPPNLKQAFIPYRVNGNIYLKPLHSIFATTFKPDRDGVIHVMEMYILLIVNEAEHGTVRVAQQKINKFRWDRNPYYISAATGTILKKIFTNTLGKKVESF